MQIARKVAVSLLVCVLLFAGVCIFAFTSLFNIVETRFYDRAVLNSLNGELTAYTDFAGGYLDELRSRFSGALREDAVRRSFAANHTGEDIRERGKILDALCLSLPELLWMRFVDTAENRVYYSTDQTGQIPADHGTARQFDRQPLSGANQQSIAFDEGNGQLVFYFPLYDSMDIRRGEALFAVSIRAFGERFIGSARIRVTDDISVISNPDGIVIGVPPHKTALLRSAIVSLWTSGGYGPGRLYTPQSESLAMLSAKTDQGMFVGLVVSEKLFSFPASLKALLVGSIFITLFVIFFLVINVKQDAAAVVQGRLKELQVSLMYEYYQLMGDMDWAVWRRELEQRRDDVRKDLCRDIKIKKGSDIEGYINSFFNRSWDGLLAAIGSRTGMITTFDEAKLEAILSRVLSASKPSGGDYDYEFQTPGHDDYDIEEFQSADAPAAAGRRGAGEVYAGNALPDAEADSFGEFEEAGMDAGEPPADGGQPDDWEELEDAGMADDGTNEGKETSGFHNGISLFTYSPRNMYSSLRNSPDVTDAPEFAEQDEDLPELYGDDEQALADRPVSGPVEPSYGEFVRGAPSAYPHKIFVPPPETAAEAGEPVIKKSSNGIDYINSAALTGADSDTSNIDPEMKHLVESVLRKPAGF